MTARRTRLLSALLLSTVLALPAAAQARPMAGSKTTPSLLTEIWRWVSSPIAALFNASLSEDPGSTEADGRSGWDPNGGTTGDSLDGRGGWDPNGSEPTGRGAWDPDGSNGTLPNS